VAGERLKRPVGAGERAERVLAAARVPHQVVRVCKGDVLARPEHQQHGALVERVRLIDRVPGVVECGAARVLVDTKELGEARVDQLGVVLAWCVQQRGGEDTILVDSAAAGERGCERGYERACDAQP
jgi:hypothetical protein